MLLSTKKISARILAGALASAATPALAYSGGPLVGFAQSVLDFLTATLGPIIFALGLAVSAYGFIEGHREALQRGVYVVIDRRLVGSSNADDRDPPSYQQCAGGCNGP